MTRRAAWRRVLYYRFHGLLPLVNSPTAQGFWLGLKLCFWLVYFGFIALVLALRYSILPNIESHRPRLEQLATRALGQPVSIGRIEASWYGINPDLTLFDVRIADAEGRPALAFSRVETILSWWSVPRAQLRLRLLRIDEPTLSLRRDSFGKFHVAGIPVGQSEGGGSVADWVLAQHRIRIQGATLVWEDELRVAPPLVLEDVNFALDNDGGHHRIGLTALPPANLAAAIDVRADLLGDDFARPERWSGSAYAAIDYADLAVWRQWVDYPLDLPRGAGALRAWFDLGGGELRGLTTDLALQNADLRLAADLPMLELDRLAGRVVAHFSPGGFALEARQLALETRGVKDESATAPARVRIEPSDFQLAWQSGALPATSRASASTGAIGRIEAAGASDVNIPAGSGSLFASRLDLGALGALARHFPLDARSRRGLAQFAPQGEVSGLNVKWTGDAGGLRSYSLSTGFSGLALAAQGASPGFSGLAGRIDASEKGGKASIAALKSTIDLPTVFPVSLIELDSLKAIANWTLKNDQLELRLTQAEFAGPEAAGTAQGLYRTAADGPGYVDLTAALTRAGAKAVWRYMPHAVGEGARFWLRDSLLAGTSNEAKLTLRGNLEDFPFLDKSRGEFLVKVKARDVVLDYGKGWPRIEGIHGDLRFEGNGMTIEAQRGTILGAKLSNTHVEIPDFDAPISNLKIKGQADGPTSEFLKFIDQSPVAERIDHFTDGMQAAGNGHLDIRLHIPLDEAKLPESKIDGDFRFQNNDVTVDSGLPPIRQVNGNVQFSGSDLRIPEITGSLLGGPLAIKGGLQKDGNVLITANGTIGATHLQKEIGLPWLSNLSGSTPYRGEVRINKRNADLIIDSTLQGLASSLPAPFAKAAADSLPLHFEKILLPAASRGNAGEKVARDQLSATLGDVMSLQFVRRKEAAGFAVERGALAVGRALQLPERGVNLAITARQLDLDRWRSISQVADGAADAKAPAASAPSFIDSVNLKADDVLLLGHHLREVDLAAEVTPTLWKARLNSQQAVGDLQWEGAGRGKLTAHLRKVVLDQVPESKPVAAANATASPASTPPPDAARELPAIDFVADDVVYGKRQLGRLELQAVNDGSVWRLDRILASSPSGTLSGSGTWHVGGDNHRTQLNFGIDSSDVGKYLDRLGYPGAVRGGNAKLGGKIGWNASPADLDFASLSGEMNLEAGKGQFLKLDPGAAGKLLGLMSLQGLPRRISLDFKDVFSEGFAFDSISSKLAVQGGVMRTERLQIDGPSARVVMRGEVDLQKETQRLNVTVQPELGGTAALGIALINPVAGVATWVAHKMLQNPLNQIFSYDYLVTGTWDDPKVEKVAGRTPPAKPATPNVPDAPAQTAPAAPNP